MWLQLHQLSSKSRLHYSQITKQTIKRVGKPIVVVLVVFFILENYILVFVSATEFRLEDSSMQA